MSLTVLLTAAHLFRPLMPPAPPSLRNVYRILLVLRSSPRLTVWFATECESADDAFSNAAGPTCTFCSSLCLLPSRASCTSCVAAQLSPLPFPHASTSSTHTFVLLKCTRTLPPAVPRRSYYTTCKGATDDIHTQSNTWKMHSFHGISAVTEPRSIRRSTLRPGPSHALSMSIHPCILPTTPSSLYFTTR